MPTIGSSILTLHDPATAGRYYASGLWSHATLYNILENNAIALPDAPAVRDGARRMTWRELRQATDAMALSLAAAGLRRAARVSVWLPSRIEVFIAYLACSRNGYICNASLHQNYSVGAVADLLKRINSSALVAMPGYGSDADRADIFAEAQTIPGLLRIFRVSPHLSSQDSNTLAADESSFGSLVQPFPSAHSPDAFSPPTDNNPDKIVSLAFTSGTTGSPKGVLHSDNTLLANARTLIEDWRHPADTILMCLSPTSHAIGTIAMTQGLLGRYEVVLNSPRARQGGVAGTLDWIIETGATYVMGVPTHALDVLDEAASRGLTAIGRVRTFYMGGSAISRHLAQNLLDRGIRPQNVYGMTENGAHQYTRPDDTADTVIHTCGRSCRGYEVRIWHSDHPDQVAGPDEVGEIGGRGACLMLGYFADQRATEEAFNRDGWFMSGDLGRIDAQGNLQVLGRKKDLIIRGGRNIYPIHIETLAMRHPAVLKASAFSVDDERLGEKVCLAVIAREEKTTIDAMDLLAFLDAHGLSKHDMPEYFMQLTSFPTTASGKIVKRELIELVRGGHARPHAVRWAGRDQLSRQK